MKDFFIFNIFIGCCKKKHWNFKILQVAFLRATCESGIKKARNYCSQFHLTTKNWCCVKFLREQSSNRPDSVVSYRLKSFNFDQKNTTMSAVWQKSKTSDSFIITWNWVACCIDFYVVVEKEKKTTKIIFSWDLWTWSSVRKDSESKYVSVWIYAEMRLLWKCGKEERKSRRGKTEETSLEKNKRAIHNSERVFHLLYIIKKLC